MKRINSKRIIDLEKLISYITVYSRDKGVPPSLQEIANHFLCSIGLVRQSLHWLKHRGVVDWDKHKSRTLRVVGPLK